MARNPMVDADVDKLSVIDEVLMKDKIKNNDDDHETRILALEGAGGGGGGSAFIDAVGKIKAGGIDDAPRFWKRRFHLLQHTIGNGANIEGFDINGDFLEDRFLSKPNYVNANTWAEVPEAVSNTQYLGYYMQLAKDQEINFKSKKGENFFSVGYSETPPANCDNIEVFINGQTPTSLGLTDENGNAAVNNWTQEGATNRYKQIRYFFGLDETEEQIITIKNNDSATTVAWLNFIEVGFRSFNPTISHRIKVSAGQAEGRFGSVSFPETDLDVSEPGEGSVNGQTCAVVASSSGLEILNGESPAMAWCRPGNIVFSGAVTSLPLNNTFAFKDSGICMLQLPNGQHHIFSYNGKTDAVPAANSLDNIIWQSKPDKDFNPLSGFGAGAPNARGDIIINYLGSAPIIINATNEKLDFQITINGVQTSHTATIANGAYSADLVSLETAINKAMQTAKPISGKYFAKYSSENQTWTIGTNDNEVSELQFLFSTGASSSNSIHPTLGYSTTDLVGKKSYQATIEVQHLSAKVFQADENFINPESPKVRYTFTDQALALPVRDDIEQRLNIGRPRHRNFGGTNTTHAFRLFPDDDVCGLSITFLAFANSTQMTYRIDGGAELYTINPQLSTQTNAAAGPRGRLVTTFVSFPRGTHFIEFYNMRDVEFSAPYQNAGYMIFFGARQYFTKPAWEKVPLTKAIVKTFDVAPLSLYETLYGMQSGSPFTPYSPTTGDNIDSYTEIGSWGGLSGADCFNGAYRYTDTLNDYVEIEFTTQKDGGAFVFWHHQFTAPLPPVQIGIFLNTAVSGITEGTDRIRNIYSHTSTTFNYVDQMIIIPVGVAGSYVIRIKNEIAGRLRLQAYGVRDQIPPTRNVFQVTDAPNNYMSTTYPVNTIKQTILVDDKNKVPKHLTRTSYLEGKVAHTENASSIAIVDANVFEDVGAVLTDHSFYANYNPGTRSANDYVRLNAFCKSFSYIHGSFGTIGNTMQGSINGSDTVNNYDSKQDVKNGLSSAGAVRTSDAKRFTFLAERDVTFSTGNTFNCSLTIGLKTDMRALLYDGTSGLLEDVAITTIVADTSFNVKKPRTIVTDANVTLVLFYGFHSLKVRDFIAGQSFPGHFEYEPLPISSSKSLARLQSKRVTETKTIYFKGIANGADLFYPLHSDGVLGDWQTSIITKLGSSTATGFNFNRDLRDVTVLAGTLDVKITSVREVPVEIDERTL